MMTSFTHSFAKVLARRSVRAGLLACTAWAALSGQALAAEAAADADSVGLEEVVVTAEKRETNLQKTPISISVVTAEAMAAGDSPLTPREADVLEAAAGGAPVETIAANVSLSAGTVRNYLSDAIGKTATRNKTEAALLARRNGWL